MAQNPADVTVVAGATATFQAAATGTPTPTVQWQKDAPGGSTFVDIPGATSTTYTTGAATSSDDGTLYRAVFTNSSDSRPTSPATLTVAYLAVVNPPVGLTKTAGQSATFTAKAIGNVATTVQWQSAAGGSSFWINIPGATQVTSSGNLFSTSYTVGPLTSDYNGDRYRAVFTNLSGTVTSSSAALTVNSITLTQSPANAAVTCGGTASFTAAATGYPTPTVQWQMRAPNASQFTNIPGATSGTGGATNTSTYTINNVTAAQSGTLYRAIFTNAAGGAPSSPATLTCG